MAPAITCMLAALTLHALLTIPITGIASTTFHAVSTSFRTEFTSLNIIFTFIINWVAIHSRDYIDFGELSKAQMGDGE
jgi:hypothetical protein